MTGSFLMMLAGVPEEDAERIRDCMLQIFITDKFEMKKNKKFKGTVSMCAFVQLKNDG